MLAKNKGLLIATGAQLILIKSAKRTGLRSLGEMFSALLALAFHYSPRQQLLPRKNLSLEDIDAEESRSNGESDHQIMPDRYEPEGFQQLDEFAQKLLGQDIVDGFDNFTENRDEGNNQQMRRDQGLDVPAFSDADVVPNVKNYEEGQKKKDLHTQSLQRVPEICLAEVSP